MSPIPYAWFVESEDGNVIYWTRFPNQAKMAEKIAAHYGRPLLTLFPVSADEIVAKRADLEKLEMCLHDQGDDLSSDVDEILSKWHGGASC